MCFDRLREFCGHSKGGIYYDHWWIADRFKVSYNLVFFKLSLGENLSCKMYYRWSKILDWNGYLDDLLLWYMLWMVWKLRLLSCTSFLQNLKPLLPVRVLGEVGKPPYYLIGQDLGQHCKNSLEFG